MLEAQGFKDPSATNEANVPALYRCEIEKLRAPVEMQMAMEISSWRMLNHKYLTKFLDCPFLGNRLKTIMPFFYNYFI